MLRLDGNDAYLDNISGGTDAYNAAAVDAAIAAYNPQDPTQGVINFQHSSTVYNGNLTLSTSWIPSADLYVMEDYDATNGQAVSYDFVFNGNGYDANAIGGDDVQNYTTAYGYSLADSTPNGTGSSDTTDPGAWLEAYILGGGAAIDKD